MSDIVVTSDELISYASQLNAMSTEVMDIFTKIKNNMNTLQASWQSPAGMALMTQFTELQPVFDNYISVLQAYEQYLKQTAQSYTENEEMLRTVSG